MSTARAVALHVALHFFTSFHFHPSLLVITQDIIIITIFVQVRASACTGFLFRYEYLDSVHSQLSSLDGVMGYYSLCHTQ